MTLLDVVVFNTYFCIERSGLPITHRDLWRDEAGGLNIYLFGLYFCLANNNAQPAKAEAGI